MRLFCDQCGTEFGTGTLRPDSKFCSLCGKSLSEYIKEHATNLLETTPNAGRPDLRHVTGQAKGNPVGRPRKTTNEKRKSVDVLIDEPEDGQESDSESPRKTRSRKRPSQISAEVDTNDDDLETSTTEGNQDTEETEVLVVVPLEPANRKGLGKGKRIRKSTQRYTDDPAQPQRLSKKPIPKTGFQATTDAPRQKVVSGTNYLI
jgi:hypothetical protein